MEIRKPTALRLASTILGGNIFRSPRRGGAFSRFRISPMKWWENIQLDDGSVHEWIELVGEPTMTLLDFVEERWQSPFDPSSLDFQIWLAWHDDPVRIYLAFVGSDDVYKNTQDYSVDWIPSLRDDFVWGQNDCIALTIDANHSGGAGIPPGGESQVRIC